MCLVAGREAPPAVTPSAALPFTGPGDTFLAIALALLMATGGMLAFRSATNRETIMSLGRRTMGSRTGFRVVHRATIDEDGDV